MARTRVRAAVLASPAGRLWVVCLGAQQPGAGDVWGRRVRRARWVSLGAVGRKVDVVELAIRLGKGQDPELGRISGGFASA